MAELIEDRAIVLHVKDWQTADKYVLCFSRDHGKLRFVAYGARYGKNAQGRLLQPFAHVQLVVQLGQRLDKLKECSLYAPPLPMDIKQMAYGSVITELTALFTEDHQPQEDLYDLLEQVLGLLGKRNPRVLVSAFAIKLLGLAGLAPYMEACVGCGGSVGGDGFFSKDQGGLLCCNCNKGSEACSKGVQDLWQQLAAVDLANPTGLKIKGQDLMDLERLLYKLLLFHTDKPLKSLDFLSQLGL